MYCCLLQQRGKLLRDAGRESAVRGHGQCVRLQRHVLTRALIQPREALNWGPFLLRGALLKWPDGDLARQGESGQALRGLAPTTSSSGRTAALGAAALALAGATASAKAALFTDTKKVQPRLGFGVEIDAVLASAKDGLPAAEIEAEKTSRERAKEATANFSMVMSRRRRGRRH